MGLEVGGRGGTKEEKEEEKEKEEKIPHMCESIGHRPLRGRCPKGKSKKLRLFDFLVACYRTLHPALLVRPSVCHTLLFGQRPQRGR